MIKEEEKKLAIIGAGPTALYILKHFLENVKTLNETINSIIIIEKNDTPGMGFPFNPNTTDVYNYANIACDEIPDLTSCLTDWLMEQKEANLDNWNINTKKLNKKQLHCRIAIGTYFEEQFHIICKRIQEYGIQVKVYNNTEAIDITPGTADNRIKISLKDASPVYCKIVAIASGHKWIQEDSPELNYFSSPWPIKKFLPPKNTFYNFPIGLLGASLSAFDVTTSLAHRHGEFKTQNKKLVFIPHPEAKDFKIVLHASQGWLPHLQYEQKEARREVYRHTTREELLSLRNKEGFVELKDFYQQIAKPKLIKALTLDGKVDLANKMQKPNYSFKNLVDQLSKEHTYSNSFEGLRKEIETAEKKVSKNKPTFWMETLDDLMYTINFHADLLAAEDHIFLRDEVFSFLMNVIAALPIKSAKIILALYEANAIELVEGKVTIKQLDKESKQTSIEVTNKEGKKKIENYKMFINCAGQQTTSVVDYPFPTLIKKDIIANATAKFVDYASAKENLTNKWKDKINHQNGIVEVDLGGIQIDSFFRVVNKDKEVHPNIYDVSLAHISGARPYSYGLQACDAVAAIVIEAMKLPSLSKDKKEVDIEKATGIYEQEI